MREKIYTVTVEQKRCDSCRKKLAEMETEVEETSDEDSFHYRSINNSIIGESPVIKSKLQGAHYSKKKLTKIKVLL